MKSVKENGPAHQAGLCTGAEQHADCVSLNGCSRRETKMDKIWFLENTLLLSCVFCLSDACKLREPLDYKSFIDLQILMVPFRMFSIILKSDSFV